MKTSILFLLAMLAQISVAQTLVEREVFYTNPPMVTTSEQDEEADKHTAVEHQTLLNGPNSFGAYVGFSNGFGVYNGLIGYTSSCRVMFVANHCLGIGFGGKAFVTAPEEKEYTGRNPEITEVYSFQSGGYGGLYLEPVIWSMKPIHVSFPILLGAGAVGRTQWDNTMLDEDYDYDYETNNSLDGAFLIVEPGAEIEVNIARWLRVGAGAYYRFTSDVDGFYAAEPFPMDGFSYELSLKIGWF